MGKFALFSLLAMLALGVLLANNLKSQIRERAAENAKNSAQAIARLGIQPLLKPEDFSEGLSPRRLKKLDSALRTKLIGKEVSAIRIWNRKARVVYAEDHDLIGQTFQDNDELEEALDGEVVSELFDPAKAEQVKDATSEVYRNQGDLIEVYVPLVFGSQVDPSGVFEIYMPYSPIATAIAEDTERLYVLLGGGLLLMWAILLPIAARTGRVLRDQAARLEGLLSRERQTVTKLQELNKMKSDFISTASHEMRTPLTTIIGFAKSLRQSEFAANGELRQEFLQRMERQGDRLLQLVDQLLHTARLEDGRGKPTLAPFDFAELAREVVSTFHDERLLRLDVPKEVPQLVSDRAMVGLILSNLVGNAMKYSPGGTLCTVGARVEGDRFRFWVADQGIGMSGDQLEHIFEAFWQADSSHTRETGGVGLGLYLVQLLTSALGGEISVVSQAGKGTRFTITLPTHRAPASAKVWTAEEAGRRPR